MRVHVIGRNMRLGDPGSSPSTFSVCDINLAFSRRGIHYCTCSHTVYRSFLMLIIHPLRSKKTDTELAVHVPLIMRVPWKLQSIGKRTTVKAELVDL
jgi:hypothetical protein